MKILYVDLQYAYGIKARGENIIGLDGFKKSFEKLGHEVVCFFYDDYLNNLKILQEKLKEFADEQKPDLIYFCLFKNQFEIETLDYLMTKYITVNWFGDDQWRFDDFTCFYAKHFTYCITTDKYSIQKYIESGQKNVIYSQWAAVDAHKVPTFGEYIYDISFVGAAHPYRRWFINTLRKRGIDIIAFGEGWENGSLSAEDMNKLFTNTKINLNIANSNSFDIRYLLSHWKPIPLALINKKNASQMKARNFEIAYFNGFQLTDYIPSLEDYFDIGREIICYKDVDEAELLIRYYLKNDTEREGIKMASHNRAILKHGYIHRFIDIFKQIK